MAGCSSFDTFGSSSCNNCLSHTIYYINRPALPTVRHFPVLSYIDAVEKVRVFYVKWVIVILIGAIRIFAKTVILKICVPRLV